MKHQNKPFPFAINFKSKPIHSATSSGAASPMYCQPCHHTFGCIKSPKAQFPASYYTNGGSCLTILRTAQLRGFLLWRKLLFLVSEYAVQHNTQGFYCVNLYKEKGYTNCHTKFSICFPGASVFLKSTKWLTNFKKIPC
jgi:hypothetical protein